MLFQGRQMLLLLLFHISKRRGNGSLEIFVLLLHLLRGAGVPFWLEAVCSRRSNHPRRLTVGLFQAHCKSLFQVFVKSIVNTRIARLHHRCASLLMGIGWRPIKLLVAFPSDLRIAAIVDAHGRLDAKMRQSGKFTRALLIEAVSTVSAVVFPIREREWCSAPHTDIGVCPLGRRTAINHATGDGLPRRELIPFFLQIPVDISDVGQVMAPFGGSRPGLYEFEHSLPDVVVDTRCPGCLQK